MAIASNIDLNLPSLLFNQANSSFLGESTAIAMSPINLLSLKYTIISLESNRANFLLVSNVRKRKITLKESTIFLLKLFKTLPTALPSLSQPLDYWSITESTMEQPLSTFSIMKKSVAQKNSIWELKIMVSCLGLKRNSSNQWQAFQLGLPPFPQALTKRLKLPFCVRV